MNRAMISVGMRKKAGSQELERLEGICLKVLNYQENDTIIYIFTETQGVCHLIGKRTLSKKWGQIHPTPLMHAEFLYLKKSKKNPLLICKEITLINTHLLLRSDYSKLEAACKMAKMIYDSQLPGNPAPLLYELFKRYLNEVQNSFEILNLLLSFQLKCLRHEGVFSCPPRCEVCSLILKEAYYLNSYFYCAGHTPDRALFLNGKEIQYLEILGFSCNFKEIKELTLEESFVHKVECLIEDSKKFF